MALFPWGKRKNSEPQQAPPEQAEEEVVEEVVDEAWQRLQVAINGNPMFRLMTFDGLYWIDPFNGELISAPFDLEDTIRAHFKDHDHWRTGRTKSPVQLYAQRWARWLEEDRGRDARFAIFGRDGRWFNPCEQRFSSSISQEMAGRPAHLLRRMAQELAQSPQASPHTLPALEELEVAAGLREAPPPPAQEESAGYDSGIRLTQSALPGSMSSGSRPAVNPAPAAEPGVAVPPGHVAYVVPAGAGPTAAPGAVGGLPAGGGSQQPLPALAMSYTGQAQALVAAAVRDIQAQHGMSDTALERRIAEASPDHRLPADSTVLLKALQDLREALDRDTSSRAGPSNQEIYNCLISMRDDSDTGELRRKQESGGGAAMPVVSQSQLSQEAIETLVSSLRSISLVADRITTGHQRSHGASPEPGDDDSGVPPEEDDDFDSDPQLEDDEDLPPSVDPFGPDAELAEDMEKAGAVQGHLLGGIPPLTGVDLAIEYRPYTSIGGDFYQVVKLGDERFFFMVGDVSGHGIQAALIVSSIVNSLKIILRRAAELSLGEIICELNDYMRECLPTGKFFTAFSGILDTSGEAPELECVCSGHHPTICLNPRHEEPIREIGRHGLGIGIVRSETFRKQMHSERYTLSPGDVLAIYTDGITETMDENGEELGEMLVRCSFFAHMDLDPHLQIQAVLGDIAEESDGVVNDDLTVMVIRIHGDNS